jgi:hypothetical protein
VLTGNTARPVGKTRDGFRVLQTLRGLMSGLVVSAIWYGVVRCPYPNQDHREPQDSHEQKYMEKQGRAPSLIPPR